MPDYSDAARAASVKGGSSFVKGEKAGGSFASSAEARSQKRADAFRKAKKKSFAWNPPSKRGQDPEWDSYNDAEDAKEKASPIVKTGM